MLLLLISAILKAGIVAVGAVGFISDLCGRPLRWPYAVVLVAAVLVGVCDLVLLNRADCAVLDFVIAAAGFLLLCW